MMTPDPLTREKPMSDMQINFPSARQTGHNSVFISGTDLNEAISRRKIEARMERCRLAKELESCLDAPLSERELEALIEGRL